MKRSQTYQMNEINTDGFVRVVFRIKKECWEPTSDQVGIMGNHAKLGQWNTDLAPRTSFIGHGEWQLETWLPMYTLIYFKLFSVDPRSNHIHNIEDIPNRELPVKDISLFIELEYNQLNNFNVSKMTSQLTPSGKPFVLPGARLGTIRYFLADDDDSGIDDVFDGQEKMAPKLHSVCGKLNILTRDHPEEHDGGQSIEDRPNFRMFKYDEATYKSPLDGIIYTKESKL